jgi:hypothetical protein
MRCSGAAFNDFSASGVGFWPEPAENGVRKNVGYQEGKQTRNARTELSRS